MVKLNIVNNGFVEVPFNENLPTIEVTEEEFGQIKNGQLRYENGKLVDSTERLNAYKKIAELKQWFETYYAQHFQKYNRLIALGKLTDEGTDPQEELFKLYETAETKRKRIQELENLLKVE